MTNISPARVEAFSDGVFAIAITLLIIEIEGPPADADLLKHLLDLWPSYVGYTLSFLLIGQVWLNHHAMFQKLRSVDQWTLICNLILLLDVAFLPFATAVLASTLESGEGTEVGAVFYGLVMVVGGVFFTAVWWSASRGGRHLKPTVSPAVAKAMTLRFAMGPFLYAVATGLGLVNAWLSIGTYVLLIGFYMMENRPRKLPARRRGKINAQPASDESTEQGASSDGGNDGLEVN